MKPKYTTSRSRFASLGTSLVTAIVVCLSSAASAANWTGTTSTDWETISNWTGVVGYAGSNAVVNTSAPNIATITADFAFTPVDIIVADGATAQVNHRSGLAKTGSGNWMFVGRNGGSGVYNLADTTTPAGGISGFAQGSGSINVGQRLYVGGFDTGAGAGTFNMNTSGTVNAPNEFHVGHGSGTGTFNLESGTLNVGLTVVGQGSGSNSNLNMDGGTININGEMWLSNSAGATGNLNMSAGELNVNNWVAIGRSGGNGNLNMTGGTLNKTGNGAFIVNGGGGSGTLTQSGGLIDVQAGEIWIPENGTGTVTLSGTAELRGNYLQLGRNGGSSGTLNLDGGTLKIGQIDGGGGTTKVANFNGTQIIANGDSGDFIHNLTAANINAGGLLIDSNGFSQTVTQVLGGAGGVTKSGDGTLTLSAANTYAGATTVSGGAVALNTSSTGAGPLVLADDTTVSLSQVVIDQVMDASDVTFGTAGPTTLNLDFSGFPGNSAFAPLNATGTITLNGDVTINIADTLPVVGVMPLVSYTGVKGGSGNFVIGTLPNGVVADPISDTAGLVSINITRASTPTWEGNVDGIWSTTDNWVNTLTGLNTTYASPDPALFDDLSFQQAVTLNTTVSPGGTGTTFYCNFNNYSLNGSGEIAGTKGITKQGPANLTIGTINSYTGVTRLEAGTTIVASLTDGGVASPLGAATSAPENLIFAGGALVFTGAGPTTIDRGFTISGAGSSIDSAADLTITGVIQSTGGNFRKIGTGNLTLSNPGTNSFGTDNPGLTVDEGTLTLDGSGTQTNAIPGEFRVGSSPGISASAVLSNTSVTSGGFTTVGRGNGNGAVSTLTATDSTITSVGFSSGYDNGLADNDSDQVINLTDTVWTNNGPIHLGESNNSNSTLTLSGTTQVTNNNTVTLGRFGANSAGTITMTGDSSFTQSDVGYVAIGTNGTGTLNLQGNSNFTSEGGDFNVSDVGTSQGFLTIQDNATLSTAGLVFIGKNGGTTGTLTMDGGTFNSVSYISIARRANSTGTFTINNGAVHQTDVSAGINVGENGLGVLNVNGGSITTAGGLNLTAEGTGNGNATVNLNGGTVTTPRVRERETTVGDISTFHFNGGLLKAGTGADLNFMSTLDTADVKAGGAFIDSNGETIAINQTLLDGGGSGGLTKSGLGTLQLNMTNTYTGTTTVNAGSLGGTGSVAGPLIVAASGTIAPGTSVGTFTSGPATISGTYACELNGATADKLVVNGALDVSAATLAITEVSPASGALIIASYTGATPAAFATVTGLPSGATIDYNYLGGNEIAIIATASPYATWAGGSFTNPFTNIDPAVDFDNDGIKNLLEFVLGGDPTISQSGILPTVEVSGSDLLITFKRSDISTLPPAANVTVQVSDDLASWPSGNDILIGASSDPGPIGATNASYTVTDGGALDTIVVTIPNGAATHRFARINAVQP